MQRSVVRHPGLLLLLVASVAASLVFVLTASASGDHGVPFRSQGSLVTQSAPGPLATCGSLPNVGYTATYQGTATHLGQVVVSSTVCLEYANFAFPNLPYTVYDSFRAANGDVLNVVATGNYNVVTPPGTDGAATFVGGTGRFLHAHGVGSAHLIVDASGNVVEVVETGTLFYDASDRSG